MEDYEHLIYFNLTPEHMKKWISVYEDYSLLEKVCSRFSHTSRSALVWDVFNIPNWIVSDFLFILNKKMDVELCSFEILNRILDIYIGYSKYIKEYFPKKKPKMDAYWSFSDISFEEDEREVGYIFYHLYKGYLFGYVTKENIKEIETKIYENKDLFSFEYVSYTDQLVGEKIGFSPRYFINSIQKFFPFSIEFVKEHYDMFFINEISKNEFLMKNTGDAEFCKILFGKILENNLNDYKKFYTLGLNTDRVSISEEKIDELTLRLMVN